MEDYSKLSYDELVQLRQDNRIDDFTFLLAQEELADEYLEDMRSQGKTPCVHTASRWLDDYESRYIK